MVGAVCIAIIVVTGLAMGHNGVLASIGVGAIVTILTWQGKKVADRRGGNIEAVAAALKKAGYTDKYIAGVINKIKGGE